MANVLRGRVIAISDVQTRQPKDTSKQPVELRQLFMDCTKFDPYTGERSQYENTPLLDFQGENMKLLDGIKKDDIVEVSVDITGRQYKDEQGKTQVFNSIRPYQLRKLERRQQQAAPAPAPQQQNTQQPPVGATTQDGKDGLPF